MLFHERSCSYHYYLSGNSFLDLNSLHHFKNAEVRTAHIALIRSLASLGARQVFFLICDVKFLSFFKSGNILLNHIQLASGSHVSSCRLYLPNPFLNSIACVFLLLFLGAWMRSQPYPPSAGLPNVLRLFTFNVLSLEFLEKSAS